MDDACLHDRSDNNALVKSFPDSDMDAEGMYYASFQGCSSKVANRNCSKFKHDTSKCTERAGWLAS